MVHRRETLRSQLSLTVSWTWAGREDEYPDSRLRSQEPARQPGAGRRLEPLMVVFATSGDSTLWLNGDHGEVAQQVTGLYDTPPYQQMPAMTDATLARTRSLSGQPIQRCDPTAMRATRNGVKSSEYRKPYWTKPPP